MFKECYTYMCDLFLKKLIFIHSRTRSVINIIDGIRSQLSNPKKSTYLRKRVAITRSRITHTINCTIFCMIDVSYFQIVFL